MTTTRDDIIRIAKECGMNASPAPGDKAALGRSVPLPWLEAFFHAAQKLERDQIESAIEDANASRVIFVLDCIEIIRNRSKTNETI